jgi:predicted Ser/Thr protein kinase
MPQAVHCETCGRSLGDSSIGVCPNCLLRTAIDHGVAPALIPSLPKLHYFGDYELLEEIARGGMGVVYRARQVSLDRTVAIKMMRPGLLATPLEIERFHAEARTAAGLQHPNIVAIHEVGEIDGLHYFSMEFVDGPSLAALLRERALPPAEAAAYVKTLAETVEYAHSRGILHRDLKPSNVLIDSAGRPRITDFGLARPLHSDSTASVPGSVAGTPAYMSPEQAEGDQRLSPATDVYSLGAILYELLTGVPPFRGATQLETMRLVVDERPTPPRQLNAAVSRDLEAVCLRCLEKVPPRRYASARYLALDLDRVLHGRQIRHGVPRWAWAAAAVVLLLLLVLFTVRTEKRVQVTVLPAAPPTTSPAGAAAANTMPVNVAPPPEPSTKTSRQAPVAFAESVSPNVGRAFQETFTFRYLVPQGAARIARVQIDFHQESAGRVCDCNLFVEPESRRVLLQFDPERGPNMNVSGTIGSVAPLKNDVCSINLTDLAAEPHEGQLEIRLPVAFTAAFEGQTQIRSWPWDEKGRRGNNRIQSNWWIGQP